MKLATLKNNRRDGELILVSQDLKRAIKVSDIANTLQEALDNWDKVEPLLIKTYQQLNASEKLGFPFKPEDVLAPLPRAYQWADGSAYLNHVELVRKARGAEMPENFWHDPLMYQGGSDSFLAPCDDIALTDEAWGLDFESEVAVIVGDVPMGVTPEQAQHAIKLILLVNDISLRNLIPNELSKGFGFFHSKPSSALSPVVITPDELKTAWDGHRVHLPLCTQLNSKLFGRPNAGIGMHFDFPTLIAHAAKTRALCAGTLIGSGTVSNADRTVGSSCIAELRMLEILAEGEAKTPFMKFGDQVRIEMFDEQGKTIFGAIEQKVVPYNIDSSTGVKSDELKTAWDSHCVGARHAS